MTREPAARPAAAAPELRGPGVLRLALTLLMVCGLSACASGGASDTLRVVDVDGDVLGRYWVVRQAESVFVAPPAPREDCGDGLVVVRFVIDGEGQVAASEILSAEPPGCYEGAALRLLQTWSFVPTGVNRKRQPVRVTQRIPFLAD